MWVSSGAFYVTSAHQSSLLIAMKPWLPRPKAIWLLPLSHQFPRGSPSTTLRNITMFLMWDVCIIQPSPKKRISDLVDLCVHQLGQNASLCDVYRYDPSPDWSPSVLTHPPVPTAAVGLDGNRFGGTVRETGRTHPIILVLTGADPSLQCHCDVMIRC